MQRVLRDATVEGLVRDPGQQEEFMTWNASPYLGGNVQENSV